MQNQTAKGDSIDVAAPSGGVVSGLAYQIGSMIGISPVTAAAGVMIALAVVGCYTLAKNSAEAWTIGQLLYWDNTARKVTTVSTNNTKIGVAIAAAANPSSTGLLRLNAMFGA